MTSPRTSRGGPDLRERDVVVDGRRWHVYEAGDPSAPPVLFVHGYFGSGLFFRQNMLSIQDRWWAIAPDLPGHCRSDPWPEGEAPVEQWALLDGLLDVLGAPPAAVVGHSRGGAVAIQLAARSPRRVSSLVLVSTSGVPFTVGTLELRGMVVDPATIPADLLRAMRECSLTALGYESARRAALLEGRLERDVTPVLGQVRVPTLVVWGAQDPTIPMDVGRRVAQGIPGASLRVMEGAGHLPFVERRDEFDALLRDFLDGNGPARRAGRPS